MNSSISTYSSITFTATLGRTFVSSASTGKERDEETGYGYFGARYMDHELMTMWLSVDPMADKYPSISPYAYCAWNPVKLVDPNGRDWYQNIYSGAVYYNSDMHGAECAGTGAMKGDGWVFLGKNCMFMKNQNDLANTDYRLALTNGGSTNTIPNSPYDVLDQSTHIQVTLMLKDQDAINFMKTQGYEQKPERISVNVRIVTQNLPEGKNIYYQTDDQSYISQVHSNVYVKNPPRNPKYSIEKSTPWIDDIHPLFRTSSRTEIRHYDYSKNNNWDIISVILSAISIMM